MAELNTRNINIAMKKLADEMGVLHRTAVQETFSVITRRVTEATPVKTGRLRASWFASDNRLAPIVGESDAIGGAGYVLARSNLRARQLVEKVVDTGGALYYNNSAKYATKVERRRKFVANVVKDTKSIRAEVISRVKRLRREFK